MGGGWTLGDGTDVRSLVRTFVRSDGRKFPPVFYRTSSPSGPLPKRDSFNFFSHGIDIPSAIGPFAPLFFLLLIKQ